MRPAGRSRRRRRRRTDHDAAPSAPPRRTPAPRAWGVVASIAVAAFAAGSLFSGAPYLEHPLPGGLPLGNALTAAGLVALTVPAVLSSRARSAPRWASMVPLLLALAWLPVSVALAGNLALVFANGRGDTWIGLTACTAVAALGSLLLALLVSIARRLKRERPA